MFLDWRSAQGFLPDLLVGAWLTIYISTIAFLCGLVLAALLASARLSSFRPARWLAGAYIEIIRNTPLLLQIYIVFYALPNAGIRFSPVNATIVGLSLNIAAYLGEIVRAGVSSVPPGQLEAARTLGLSRWHSLSRITAPVCLRSIFPALTNMAVATVLGSSLASAIAIPELTGVTNEISARTFLTIEVYTLAAVIYLAITLGVGALFRLAEVWLFPKRSRG